MEGGKKSWDGKYWKTETRSGWLEDSDPYWSKPKQSPDPIRTVPRPSFGLRPTSLQKSSPEVYLPSFARSTSFQPRVLPIPLQADQSGPANSTVVLADWWILPDQGRGSLWPHCPAADPCIQERLLGGRLLTQREGCVQPEPVSRGALPGILHRHGAIGVLGLAQSERGFFFARSKRSKCTHRIHSASVFFFFLKHCPVKIFSSPQIVQERLICQAIVGSQSTNEQIMSVDITCRFVATMLSISPKELNFYMSKVGRKIMRNFLSFNINIPPSKKRVCLLHNSELQ